MKTGSAAVDPRREQLLRWQARRGAAQGGCGPAARETPRAPSGPENNRAAGRSAPRPPAAGSKRVLCDAPPPVGAKRPRDAPMPAAADAAAPPPPPEAPPSALAPKARVSPDVEPATPAAPAGCRCVSEACEALARCVDSMPRPSLDHVGVTHRVSAREQVGTVLAQLQAHEANAPAPHAASSSTPSPPRSASAPSAPSAPSALEDEAAGLRGQVHALQYACECVQQQLAEQERARRAEVSEREALISRLQAENRQLRADVGELDRQMQATVVKAVERVQELQRQLALATASSSTAPSPSPSALSPSSQASTQAGSQQSQPQSQDDEMEECYGE